MEQSEPKKKHPHCGRCGDRKALVKEGPWKNMLCEDCAGAKAHEEAREREGRV